jgi:hypothetical protein
MNTRDSQPKQRAFLQMSVKALFLLDDGRLEGQVGSSLFAVNLILTRR